MRFEVDAAIWSAFPGLRIVLAWADGVDNAGDRPELTEELGRSVSTLAASWQHPNPQSHPSIAAWRDASKSAGFSGKKFPSSIEALTRRALSGKGLGSINPLVDFYNRVSLEHLVPAGGWDLDDLSSLDLRLAFATGSETFHAIGAEQSVAVEPGEVSYIAGSEVVTRHFVWRQSELGKLTPKTRRPLLISECLAPIDDETTAAITRDLVDGLGRQFGVEASSRVVTVDSGHLEIDFGSDG